MSENSSLYRWITRNSTSLVKKVFSVVLGDAKAAENSLSTVHQLNFARKDLLVWDMSAFALRQKANSVSFH